MPSIGNFFDRNGGMTMCMTISSVLGLVTNSMWLLIRADHCNAQNNCLNYILFLIVMSGVALALVAGTH